MKNIEIDSYLDNGAVEVFDLLGIKKDQITLSGTAGKLSGQLNFENYLPGVYVLSIKTQNGGARMRVEKL